LTSGHLPSITLPWRLLKFCCEIDELKWLGALEACWIYEKPLIPQSASPAILLKYDWIYWFQIAPESIPRLGTI
jgi:hypothetical protein